MKLDLGEGVDVILIEFLFCGKSYYTQIIIQSKSFKFLNILKYVWGYYS